MATNMDDLFLEFDVREDEKVTSNPIISEKWVFIFQLPLYNLSYFCCFFCYSPTVEKRALENDDDVSFTIKKSKMESILDDIK